MADPDPIRIDLVLDAEAFANALGQQQSRMAKFRDGFVTAAAAIVAVRAGFQAVGRALKAINAEIDRVGTLQGVQQSFGRLSESVGGAEQFLGQLREATDGTVRDLDLMTTANQAIQSGLVQSGEQFAELADLAQRMGRAVGRDATEQLQGLVRVLQRGSARGLARLNVDAAAVEGRMDRLADAMGKTTSELTDQERMTLLLQAATEQMRETAERLGPEQLTVSELWGRIGVQTGNALDRLRQWIADSPEFQAVLKALAGFMSDVTEEGGALDRLMESLTAEGGRIPALGNAFRAIVDVVTGTIAAWSELKVQVNSLMIAMIETVGLGLVEVGRKVAQFLGRINELLGGRSQLPQNILDFLNTFESNARKIAQGLRAQKDQYIRDANDVLAEGEQIKQTLTRLADETAATVRRAGQAVPGAAGGVDQETAEAAKSPFEFGRQLGAGMGEVTGAARGLFSELTRAFGGSGKAAERWKKVQLGVTAAISTAEAVKEFAFGMAETGAGNAAAAAAHFIASAAHTTAAAVAGAQAAGAMAGAAGGRAGGGAPAVPEVPDIEDEDRAARITRVVINIEGNMVAGRDHIRDHIVPGINEVVKRREGTLVATQAEEATRLGDTVRTGA